jgi:hypothetical protein
MTPVTGHRESTRTDRERQGGRHCTFSGRSAEPAAPVRPSVGVPPGAPSWITSDLVADTIRVWQRYYEAPLTPDDALEMIVNVGQLLNVLCERR